MFFFLFVLFLGANSSPVQKIIDEQKERYGDVFEDITLVNDNQMGLFVYYRSQPPKESSPEEAIKHSTIKTAEDLSKLIEKMGTSHSAHIMCTSFMAGLGLMGGKLYTEPGVHIFRGSLEIPLMSGEGILHSFLRLEKNTKRFIFNYAGTKYGKEPQHDGKLVISSYTKIGERVAESSFTLAASEGILIDTRDSEVVLSSDVEITEGNVMVIGMAKFIEPDEEKEIKK